MSKQRSYGMRSLRFKLILASIAVEAVMLSVLVWNSARITGDAMQETFQDRLETLTPLMVVGITSPLVQRDYATLDERLGKIVSPKSLTYVEVRDELGKIVASRGSVPRAAHIDTSFEVSDHVYDQTFDIVLAGQLIGRARYGLNVSRMKTTVKTLRDQGAVVASVAIGLTIALLITLGALLTNRLRALAQAARTLTSGDYSVRVPVVGRDEVADTALAFNAMADALARDIAERKQAERTLKESEERFRATFEQAAVGIAQVAPDGRWLHVNQKLCDIVGYSRVELLQRSFQDITHPADLEADLELVQQLLAGETQTYGMEKRYLRKDGSQIWIFLTVGLVRQPTGEPKYFISVIEDISERKQAEDTLRQLTLELEQRVVERTTALQDTQLELRAKNEELGNQYREVQEANRLKSEFLANMSHELRTPLNAIIGFSELMHDGKVGPIADNHKEYLGDVLTSAQHLLHLINDVLDLAKVESGKMEFHYAPMDLRKVIGEVCEILRTLTSRTRVQVAIDIDKELSEIWGDASKLKQVLYNYLSNALKFSPEGGQVRVRARREGRDAYRIEVEDQGIGIKAEDIPRLFTEFQQLDLSVSKKYQGTGLGLALTKRIIEAQGGCVGVESIRDRGSLFYAILPLRCATSESALSISNPGV